MCLFAAPGVSGRRLRVRTRRQVEGIVGRTSQLTLGGKQQSSAEQLARFFPDSKPVRIPIQVTALRSGGSLPREAAVVEFGGAEHAIFVSTLPLEFDDRVRLEGQQKGSVAEAAVIAVQYNDGRKAVAVRFLHGRCEWVAKP